MKKAVVIHSIFCILIFWEARAQSADVPRPNIVLFISDDHGYEDAGCYGNKTIKTPVIDKLAREGLKFSNAFANTPTCVPSRAAIFTGLYPARNGAHPNHSRIHEGLKTLPAYMKELGYRVVLAGKTHVEPQTAYPFEYVPAFDNPERISWVRVLHDLDVHTMVKDPSGASAPFDPQEPYTRKYVTKGGSYLCSNDYCSNFRSTARQGTAFDSGSSNIGFRCVKD